MDEKVSWQSGAEAHYSHWKCTGRSATALLGPGIGGGGVQGWGLFPKASVTTLLLPIPHGEGFPSESEKDRQFTQRAKVWFVLSMARLSVQGVGKGRAHGIWKGWVVVLRCSCLYFLKWMLFSYMFIFLWSVLMARPAQSLQTKERYHNNQFRILGEHCNFLPWCLQSPKSPT